VRLAPYCTSPWPTPRPPSLLTPTRTTRPTPLCPVTGSWSSQRRPGGSRYSSMGKDGWVYSFELRFRVVENGESRVETFGSREKPFRTAFIDLDAAAYDAYDWDFASRSWIPAR
jgi:hypothetical protein